MWHQRSRVQWLSEGDKNTKFFQSKAVWRARINKIRELVDSIGIVHSDFAMMSKMANEYFQVIFTADQSLDAGPVLELLERKISDQDNDMLCKPFSDKEIADALFQIALEGSKARRVPDEVLPA